MEKNKVFKFITSNKPKVVEANAVLSPFKIEQLNIDLVEIQEIDPKKVIEHKIKEARKHHKGSFFIDDSSLYLECLNNKLPGPYIKWFIGVLGLKGIYTLCKKMGSFKAYATTYIGFSKSPGEILYFEGKLKGTINLPRGSFGFGYDQIFIPDGFNKTMSEMKAIGNFLNSPRGIAMKKFKKFLIKES
jgi:non-canonical purine NTP pyrophosphatase (RdgB/HAM1 family)